MLKRLQILVCCVFLAACASAGKQTDSEQSALLNTQLGYGYLQQGRGDLALAKFSKALEARPKHLEAQLGYAAGLASSGRYSEAEGYYASILRDHPHDLQVTERVAGFLCTQQRFPKAEKVFLTALKNKIYASVGEAYTRFSACASATGNVEHAQLYIEHAISKSPNYAPALLQKGWIALEQQRADDALEQVYLFEKLAPATADSLVLGLRSAQALGDPAAGTFSQQLKMRFPAVWRQTQQAN
jgi:type IV pilus assembly protein PilF